LNFLFSSLLSCLFCKSLSFGHLHYRRAFFVNENDMLPGVQGKKQRTSAVSNDMLAFGAFAQDMPPVYNAQDIKTVYHPHRD
jgi:hypothetical protein